MIIIVIFMVALFVGVIWQIIHEHRTWNDGISPYDGTPWQREDGNPGSEAGAYKEFKDSTGNVFSTTWVSEQKINRTIRDRWM